MDRMAPTTTGPRIALNLWHIDADHPVSLSYVAFSLVRHLPEGHPGQTQVFYQSRQAEFFKKINGFKQVRGVALKRLEDLFGYQDEFDCLYTPHWLTGTHFIHRPKVSFVPDLGFLFRPNDSEESHVEGLKLALRHAAESSTHIIVPSHYTKDTLVEKLDISGEKIRVVRHGAHEVFSDESDPGIRPSALLSGLDDYLFYPATPCRRKNHERLLDALCLLRTRYGFNVKCLFTGPSPNWADCIDIPDAIRARGLHQDVHHLGVVSLPELKYLYLNAKALIFPSLFEGFGIPLLEAMTVGCPIIASNCTSIPEVSGNAALYLNPHDTEDIAEKIHQFYHNPHLCAELASRGKRRAKKFSNTAQAEEIRDVMKEAVLSQAAENVRMKRTLHTWPENRPLLTIIVFLQPSSGAELQSAIERLKKEARGAVEVSQIVHPSHVRLLKRLARSRTETVSLSAFHGTVVSAVKQATGTFVFFSAGKAVPAATFLSYLADAECSNRLPEELLHGDTYLINSRFNRIQSTKSWKEGRMQMEAEYEKEYFCDHLPYVVRRAALLTTVAGAEVEIKSLSHLAALLYETCSKRRVFTPVSMEIDCLRPWADPYSETLLWRLKHRLAYVPFLHRLLNYSLTRHVALSLLDLWAGSPDWLRAMVRTVGTPFGHSRSRS